jgi:hypothetical protein
MLSYVWREDMGRKQKEGRRVKTSLVIPDALLQRLKLAALEERVEGGFSALLCKLATQYLQRKGR